MRPVPHPARRQRHVLTFWSTPWPGSALPAAIDLDPGGSGPHGACRRTALNSRLRHWVSDSDRARRAAESRLGLCLGELGREGIDATGAVGDPEPLQAMADSLRAFPADEIVIASVQGTRARGVTRDLAERAMGRFGLPVAQLLLAGDPAPAPASGERTRRVLMPA